MSTPPHPTVIMGGLGQSGVSTLNRVLHGHTHIATCPLETFFVVAAGGLKDLTRAISTEYSSMRVDEALARFDRLMRHDLCSPRSHPFNQIDLRPIFGTDAYVEALDGYFERIGARRFRGDGLTIDAGVRIGHVSFPVRMKKLTFPRAVARDRDHLYWLERLSRAEAVAAARSLLDGLYGTRAARLGKKVWTEQTTNNLFDVDFWFETLPDALFVHVIRDPLDVALAQQRQPWAPDDLWSVCAILRDNYCRIVELRRDLPPASWCDVRFEDLLDDPADIARSLSTKLGVAFDWEAPEHGVDRDRLRSQQPRPSDDDLKTYRTVLGPIADELGYPVP